MKLSSVWFRIRQNKFFSAIYVLGSALSVASAMLIVIYIYVKVADIYPETDRNRIFHVGEVIESMDKSSMSTVGFSHDYATTLANALDSVASDVALEWNYWGTTMVDPGEVRRPFEVKTRYVDPKYLRVFNYTVLAGTPFSQEEFDSAIECCMISDRLAVGLFGSVDDAPGRSVKIGPTEYLVRGVFREPSFIQQNSFAQILIPYTTEREQYTWAYGSNAIGSFTLKAKTPSDAATDSLRQILSETLRKFSQIRKYTRGADEDVTIAVSKAGTLTQLAFKMDDGFSWAKLMSDYGFIILVLLIVPAVNLGGLIAGNMEVRLPEMGVRKSFGANRRRLLGSVLAENMVLTSIGGILGLVIAWLLVWKWRNWMFFLDDSIMLDAPASVALNITSDMIFAPAVFAVAFILCCIINVLAAMIPAWWSLRKPIVESLSENK